MQHKRLRVYITSFLVCLVAVLMPSVSVSQTVTLVPTDDMYTDPEHSTAHPVDQLWVANFAPTGNFQRIMMKFDLSEYIGQSVDSAYLNLNRFFGCPSGGVTITNFYDITEDWDESTWPENSHISHGTTSWAEYTFGVFETAEWHRIDLTSLVQAWLDGTIPNYGFVIEAQSGSKFSKFYSREASQINQRPYLELIGLTNIDETEQLVRRFELGVYPNPFNSTCYIDAPDGATVEIYDIIGNLIFRMPSGEKSWTPDESIGSGVYLIHTTTPNKALVRRVVYLK